MRTIHLSVNGRPCERAGEPRHSLADFLREDLDLTGTHLGCEHGVCGACTVLLDGRSVRSCLIFAVQADSARVMTIEGPSPAGSLHPLQRAFKERHALQCGFCTPGMILASAELLRDNPHPSEAEIREALSGQLCMCTGYVNIVEAVLKAAEEIQIPSHAAAGEGITPYPARRFGAARGRPSGRRCGR